MPVNLKGEQDVNPYAEEPRDASEEQINEEAAVAESIERQEEEAAIENLKADDRWSWLTGADR